MTDEQRPARPTSIGEGIRSGIGLLSAFRDAIEETVQEAMDRNDLRPEKARDAMGTALDRMTGVFEEMRDRVDVVLRRDFDALREEVELLRARVADLEAKHGGAGGSTHFLPGDVGSPGVFEGSPGPSAPPAPDAGTPGPGPVGA